MNLFKSTFYFIISAFLFTSCEEVIELDLKQTEPRIVIDAEISDLSGPYTVKLSKSVDFYDDNSFPPIMGAQVIMSDELGGREILVEESPGLYKTSTTRGVRGLTYSLEVKIEGKSYFATSKIPELYVPIDTIVTGFEEGSIFNYEGYLATVYSQDPAGVENFYRLKIFVNGKVYVFDQDNGEDVYTDKNLYLGDDKFIDGNTIEYRFPHTFELGDSIDVELYHVNKASFDYYRVVSSIINGGGVAPANPISNFGTEVLGHFHAFSVSYKSTIVQ